MKTSKTTLKLIPFKYLTATTYHSHDMEFLSESVSKVVSVKTKLNELYLSLNTGGISLPFDVMQVADIIDKLKGKMGVKLSKNASFSKKPNETIELTLLSDKGVDWLNQVNKIVTEAKNNRQHKTESHQTIEDISELMKTYDMQDIGSELMKTYDMQDIGEFWNRVHKELDEFFESDELLWEEYE